MISAKKPAMTACARSHIQSSTLTPSRLVLLRLAAAAGVPLVELSRRCGRSSAWAATVGAPSRSTELSTVCDVAGALGYSVAVLDGAGRVVGTIEATRSVAAREGGSQEG